MRFFSYISILILPLLASAQSVDKAEARIVYSAKIWDRAHHNAFTDVIRFRNQWFCVFREGGSHRSPDGKLRVISSTHGELWESAALVERLSLDLRDPKFSITAQGELMLTATAHYPPPWNFSFQSLTWFSNDGAHWSEAHVAGEKDIWLWRPTWNGESAYGFGYGTGSKRGILRLYKSTDGKYFKTVVPDLREDSYPNEASILFREQGTAYCLLRRDGKERTALLGVSEPPYHHWSWKDLEVRIGGPHMIALPDGRTVAAVRLYDGGWRTSLCWLDLESGTLEEFLKLPSGRDSSYAGLVWHDDHLWISYYSGHGYPYAWALTSIYLAKVAFDQKPAE